MGARAPANRYVADMRLLDAYLAPALQGILASDLTDRRPAHVVSQALVFAIEAVAQRNTYVDEMISRTELRKQAEKREAAQIAAAKKEAKAQEAA